MSDIREDRRSGASQPRSEEACGATNAALSSVGARRLLLGGRIMAVHLHRSAATHARNLIKQGRTVRDERDAWSEHQPSAQKENDFIRRHGWREYGKWHLGVDEQEDEETKARYKFPYGDFSRVHRCGLISAESRAGQYKYLDVERAAAQLLRLLDAKRPARTATRAKAPARARRKRAVAARK
jgi:hypothetical protein